MLGFETWLGFSRDQINTSSCNQPGREKKSPVSEITFGENGAFSATWTAVRKNIITLVIKKYIHGVREGEVVRPVREMLVIFLKPLLN